MVSILEEMKTIRTYKSGCLWCYATGFITNPSLGLVTNTTITCPVCHGNKTIVVTEEFDTLYEVDCSNMTIRTPVIDTAMMRRLHNQLKEDEKGAGKIFVDNLFNYSEEKLQEDLKHSEGYLHQCDDIAWQPIRKKLNLSLRDVAKGTGISISTISRMERGKQCYLTNMVKLRHFYNNYGKNKTQ